MSLECRTDIPVSVPYPASKNRGPLSMVKRHARPPPPSASEPGERSHYGLSHAMAKNFERGREVAKIAKIAKIAKSGTRPNDTASQRETRRGIGG